MGASGIRFERTKVTPDDVEGGKPSWQSAQWVYRMEPSVDVLGTFDTAGKGFGEAGGSKQRYAVRQVLEQEWKKEEARRAEAARMARFKGDHPDQTPADAMVKSSVVGDEEAGHAVKVAVKRDFFGRPIALPVGGSAQQSKKGKEEEEGRVWVTYHEGFSNAVRKPITLGELMKGL
ncbi:hypothetical protein KC324_g17009 [Hortaea werneckii]|nr:hypothetical protein KC324_g17009 [Hortaea werneckii]